jgi:GNAT superfamily N-acetyltransferase
VSVLVREGRPEDLQLIVRFIRDLAEYEQLTHEVVLDEPSLERYLFGERPYAETLIAEDASGRPIGFALFFHNFSTFLGRPGIYLEDLFVEPAERGLGAGRALLSKLAALAIERECGRLEWAVLDNNEPAIGFYQRLGARPNSDWTTYRLAGDALQSLAKL